MVGLCRCLPGIKSEPHEDGIVGGQAVNHKECYVPSDLLRIVACYYRYCDRVQGKHPYSSKPNEQSVRWDQSFSINPHLLERRVVQDVGRAAVVD